MTPYSFQPVVPAKEAIDLGTRLFQGTVTLVELKDACGIAGCITELYDGVDVPASAFDPSTTLEELGLRLREAAVSMPDGSAAALDWGLWLPLILRIIDLIVDRIGGGSSPSPGPV
jgi:hypothetical protein